MIVGCYSMHLYCEVPYSDGQMQAMKGVADFIHMLDHNEVVEFTGPTEASCNKQARAEGWKLNLQTQQAWCREHKGMVT